MFLGNYASISILSLVSKFVHGSLSIRLPALPPVYLPLWLTLEGQVGDSCTS